MSEAIDLLWQSPRLSSIEHFSYRPALDAATLSGTVVLPREGKPTTIQYQVVVDQDWKVRTSTSTIRDRDGETLVTITADEECWWVDGTQRDDLAGCTDLDLGWTPSTNTLPIRRTRLAVGEMTTIRAAWVTFPDLIVRPAHQRYRRTGQLTWMYESGDFAAELTTNPSGFVQQYGEDIWCTVASTRLAVPTG
jgi:uncharacterized protein